MNDTSDGNGGARTRRISYAGPSISVSDAEAVYQACLHGFYENYVQDRTNLERFLAERLGVRHVLATNSCTAALHLAVAALGIGPGDEVITTDASCVASALPILYTGATPVLVDVDPSTWCLAPKAVEAAITPRTRAILAVHWNGHPADMAGLLRLSNEHGVPIIEDAAPALGATVLGRYAGTLGRVGCFSFQGAKVAIAGQGGALVTDDTELYERASCLAAYGRTDSVMTYWSDHVGWNYTMPNLPAALALSQVRRLDELVDAKRRLFDAYRAGLAGLRMLRLVEEPAGTRSTCCYPAVHLDPEARLSRSDLLDALRADGVDARPAQPRISGMPMFERRFENPEAQRVQDGGIILPAAHRLTVDDVAYVCSRIRGHLT